MADVIGELPPTPPPPKKRRVQALDTLSDVKRELASVVRRLKKSASNPDAKGAMPVEHARALVHALSQLGNVIRNGDAEEVLLRLRVLEQRQAAVDAEERVQ